MCVCELVAAAGIRWTLYNTHAHGSSSCRNVKVSFLMRDAYAMPVHSTICCGPVSTCSSLAGIVSKRQNR